MRSHGPVVTRLRRFLRQDDGPTATEYAILLALIILVAVAAIQAIGQRMYNVYEAINQTMPT